MVNIGKCDVQLVLKTNNKGEAIDTDWFHLTVYQRKNGSFFIMRTGRREDVRRGMRHNVFLSLDKRSYHG